MEKIISPKVQEALSKLDSKFGIEVIDWLAGLYDKESGGFYYAESSRDNGTSGNPWMRIVWFP